MILDTMSSSKKTDSKLDVPHFDDDRRRSMELEERPLPEGWIRDYDPSSQHHFYVGPFCIGTCHSDLTSTSRSILELTLLAPSGTILSTTTST